MQTSYRSEVLRELARDRFAQHAGNFDTVQLGAEPTPGKDVPQLCWDEFQTMWRTGTRLAEKLQVAKPIYRAAQFYVSPRRFFEKNARDVIAQGEYLYGILADAPSRDLLIKLMAYRILGHRKVKLPRNNPDYWADLERVAALKTGAPAIPVKFMDLQLAEYELASFGFDLKCFGTDPGIACTYAQRQYAYDKGGVRCEAQPGDIAIDAGSCWGDTTVYLADAVGEQGKVVAFEFIPSNLAVLHRNAALNPALARRIGIVENPLWSHAGLKLYYVDWGPGSRITPDETKYHSWEGMVETVTIDETLDRLGLPRVDFIKMDIEGAELDALKGGERSIRRHRPKIAVSLYHNPEDFETIPRYLNELDVGYKFYLEHHTIYQNETVLFAVP